MVSCKKDAVLLCFSTGGHLLPLAQFSRSGFIEDDGSDHSSRVSSHIQECFADCLHLFTSGICGTFVFFSMKLT